MKPACIGHDPEWWFPAGESDHYADMIAEAKRICRGCPVREQCLAAALDRGERFGIFGGKTEFERAAMQDGLKPCESCNTRIPKNCKRCGPCGKAKANAQNRAAGIQRRAKPVSTKPRRRAAE